MALPTPLPEEKGDGRKLTTAQEVLLSGPSFWVLSPTKAGGQHEAVSYCHKHTLPTLARCPHECWVTLSSDNMSFLNAENIRGHGIYLRRGNPIGFNLSYLPLLGRTL